MVSRSPNFTLDAAHRISAFSLALTVAFRNSSALIAVGSFTVKTIDSSGSTTQIAIALESRIAQIEAAVDTVKDDPYFPIIKMRYYDKKTNAQIAERLKCDEGTVKRHKNKMLESIRFALFKDIILEDMMGWLVV